MPQIARNIFLYRDHHMAFRNLKWILEVQEIDHAVAHQSPSVKLCIQSGPFFSPIANTRFRVSACMRPCPVFYDFHQDDHFVFKRHAWYHCFYTSTLAGLVHLSFERERVFRWELENSNKKKTQWMLDRERQQADINGNVAGHCSSCFILVWSWWFLFWGFRDLFIYLFV